MIETAFELVASSNWLKQYGKQATTVAGSSTRKTKRETKTEAEKEKQQCIHLLKNFNYDSNKNIKIIQLKYPSETYIKKNTMKEIIFFL